ncbi:MAG: hypothetical protein JO154_10925 [Chitinophaga sp.]|uniref:hypothetical protein n=1 Tax=Chitinophaga sp. TaxID=1869181 RepID=UPI0025B9646D|nr:hypothetical protein [Chitinophaga sp.]MBV8253110.1 hypothetical protein [Chitinophaga sp.]
MQSDYFKPLQVELLPIAGDYNAYDITSPMPACATVIQALLSNASYACVYGLKKEMPFFQSHADILIADKGKYRFDLTQDCINGHAYLWQARAWERGSIVLELAENKMDFAQILQHTYRPSLSETPNMGNSPAAIKKCKAIAATGNIAICFPASNGIEWMSIYANGPAFERILQLAATHCQQQDYYR